MFCMDKIDSRTLTPDAQATLRLKVVTAVRGGMAKKVAAETFGVARASVYNWVDAFEDGGKKNLLPKKRGPKTASKLLGWQAAQICNIIRDKHPEQMKFSFALWNARAVRDLIKRKFKIEYTVRYVQVLLKRWGFTPQRPKRVAYEQNSAAVERWFAEEYPTIKKRAGALKASIYWGDETGIRSDDQLGRSYAPKGETPKIKATGKRFGCNMISAISNRGALEFSVFKGRFTSRVFINFMRRLIKYRRKKILLIVDGHPAHKSKAVQKWLSDKKVFQKIEVYYLPPYSPELNPDEYLNNDLKTNAVRNRVPRTQQKLMSNVRRHMDTRRSDPEQVKKFFHAEPVKYAK